MKNWQGWVYISEIGVGKVVIEPYPRDKVFILKAYLIGVVLIPLSTSDTMI